MCNKCSKCKSGNCDQVISLPNFCIIIGTDFKYIINFENITIDDSIFTADYFDIQIIGNNQLELTISKNKSTQMGIGQYPFSIMRKFINTGEISKPFQGLLNIQR